MAAREGIKKIVLLSCGSFNPITNMHLRMFGKSDETVQYFLCIYRGYSPEMRHLRGVYPGTVLGITACAMICMACWS